MARGRIIVSIEHKFEKKYTSIFSLCGNTVIEFDSNKIVYENLLFFVFSSQ